MGFRDRQKNNEVTNEGSMNNTASSSFRNRYNRQSVESQKRENELYNIAVQKQQKEYADKVQQVERSELAMRMLNDRMKIGQQAAENIANKNETAKNFISNTTNPYKIAEKSVNYVTDTAKIGQALQSQKVDAQNARDQYEVTDPAWRDNNEKIKSIDRQLSDLSNKKAAEIQKNVEAYKDYAASIDTSKYEYKNDSNADQYFSKSIQEGNPLFYSLVTRPAWGDEYDQRDLRVGAPIEDYLSGYYYAGSNSEALNNLTEDQQKEYSYILGKYGRNKADDYLNSVAESAKYYKAYEKVNDATWKEDDSLLNGVAKLGSAIGTAAASGIEGFSNSTLYGLDRWMDDLAGRPASEEEMIIGANQIAKAILVENSSGAKKTALNVAENITQMLPTQAAGIATSILTGGASLLTQLIAGGASTVWSMAPSSYGQAYSDAISNGYGTDKAKKYATASAANEALGEFLLGGVEGVGGQLASRVLSTVPGLDTIMQNNPIVGLAIDSLQEGAEEIIQGTVDMYLRNDILGENNQIKLLSEENMEAAKIAAISVLLQNGAGAAIDTYKIANLNVSNLETAAQEIRNCKPTDFTNVKTYEKAQTVADVLERLSQKKADGKEITLGDKVILNTALMEMEDAASEGAGPTALMERDRQWNETLSNQAKEYAKGFGETGQKTFLDTYNTEGTDKHTVSSDEYRAYAAYYNYGRFGAPVSTEAEANASKYMTTAQKTEAMRAGAKDANKMYPADITSKIRNSANGIKISGVKQGVIDSSQISYKDLTEQQKLNVDLISNTISKGFGFDVVLAESVEDKTGKYSMKSGANYHAAFEMVNGRPTIYLDVNAGMNSKADWSTDIGENVKRVMPVLAHEITHWMEQADTAAYKQMSDTVIRTLISDKEYIQDRSINEYIATERNHMQRLADEKARRSGETAKQVTDADALHEIVARSCEDMLNGNKTMEDAFVKSLSRNQKRTLMEHINQLFRNVREFFQKLLGHYESDSNEAKAIRRNMEAYEDIRQQWAKILDQSISEVEFNDNGVATDAVSFTSENNVQLTERTYREGGRDYLNNWLNDQVKSGDISSDDAKDIMSQMDIMYDLMQKIKKKNPDLDDYSQWAETVAQYNENGDKLSVIVKNGDYAMNLDFSTVCKKRKALNAVLNSMVTSGKLNINMLTESDVATLNDIIKSHDFEIACALCFVDSKRYRVGNWATSFTEGTHDVKKKEDYRYGFNEMVRSLVPKGSGLVVDEYNFTGREMEQPKGKLLKDYDGKLDYSLINKIMKEYGPKTAQYRIAKAIKANPSLRSTLNAAEIISSIGLDKIRVENAALYGLINAHQGTAKPKFSLGEVAYVNDILRASNFNKESAYKVGGVRLQSFSDFMANMVFDYVQMIGEMQAKQLPAHSYTKEAAFVMIFGQTGMKINMSLVPKATTYTAKQVEEMNDSMRSKLKKIAGLKIDKNGKHVVDGVSYSYMWEDETFPYEVAMKIQADPAYSKNCGTIAVGISDTHIRALLQDPTIQMVIPYHKSGLPHVVAMMRNISLYNDYTDYQNTRHMNGSKLGKSEKDFDFYGYLYGDKTFKDGSDAYAKTGRTPKDAADAYLKWCDEHGYLPKFDQFRDNANYYKLLTDFRVYDTDGSYAPQNSVTMTFPETKKLNAYITKGVSYTMDGKKYTSGGLAYAQKVSEKLKAETDQIVAEFEQQRGMQLSSRDAGIDIKYRAAIKSGNMKDAQKIVDEAAMAAGYDVAAPAYHGSPENKIKVFRSINTEENGANKIKGYFSNSYNYASTYGNNVNKYYLKMDNPLWLDPTMSDDYTDPSQAVQDMLEQLKRAGVTDVRLNDFMNNEEELAEWLEVTVGQLDPWMLVNSDGGNLTERIQAAGYDGIAWMEGYDEDMHYDPVAYMPFNESAIKRADAMTYDDNGQLVMPSQRFNDQNSDVRYKQRDQEYMDAVKNSDTQVMSRLVKQAAAEAGYTKRALHGTSQFGFTKIDTSKSDDNISFFATDSEETADSYSFKAGTRPITQNRNQAKLAETYVSAAAEYDESLHTFAEHLEQVVGIRSWMDYNVFSQQFKAIVDLFDPDSSKDDIVDRMDDFIDDWMYSAFEVATADEEDPEYDEFICRDEVQKLYDDVDDIYKKAFKYKSAYNDYWDGKGSVGNYDLYVNTDNMIELDAKGADWRSIPLGEYEGEFEAWNDQYYKRNFTNYTFNGSVEVNTRDLAAFAKGIGARGAIVHNLIDDGGNGDKVQNPATVYIFLDPQRQVKSADNITYDDQGNVIPLSERFNAQNDDLRYKQRDEYAPVFYSNLQRQIEAYKGDKLGANSVEAFLLGKGVKEDEIKWSGIRTFLEGKKSVTKAELLDFLKANQLQVQEVTRDNRKVPATPKQQERIALANAATKRLAYELKAYIKKVMPDYEFAREDLENQSMGSLIRHIDDYADRKKVQTEVGKRYQDQVSKAYLIIQSEDDFGYDTTMQALSAFRQEPDAFDLSTLTKSDRDELIKFTEYYEEFKNLQVVPLDQLRKIRDLADKISDYQSAIAIATQEISDNSLSYRTNWSDFTIPGAKNYREYVYYMPGSDYSNAAMDAHWNDKGVLAHARVDDFEASDGKKVMFVEEIQSDWHNAGAKLGYNAKTWKEYESQLNEIASKFTETEEYKSIHKKAYDYGYEGIGLELIADKMLESNSNIDYYTVLFGLSEKEKATALKYAAQYQPILSLYELAPSESVPDAPYSKSYTDFVLKNLLRKAAEGGYDYLAWTTGQMQEERWSSEFAEGYRIEYDQDIPKFLNKYGKQWGARVGETKIYGGWDAEGNGAIVPSIPITESMKQSVLYEGQPQFRLRGYTEEGTEVYETSDEVKALTVKERMDKFQDIMANEYRGRTARFVRNGHIYYASYEDVDITKNIYGDTQSSKAGWKAKINEGADGSFFDLVENSTYKGSSKETGKDIPAHKGVKFWDYFVKSVQINNSVYDLIANVRKREDGEYVYNIALNKSNKKAAPLVTNLIASKKSGDAINKISQYSENSNIQTSERGRDIQAEYDAFVKKYGALPKGEKAVTDFVAPAKTDNGSVSRFARTAGESGWLDAGMQDALKEEILNDAMTYQVATDAAAENYAKHVIESYGESEAQKRWDAVVNGTNALTKDDVALGEMLLTKYAEAGDTASAMKMVAELAAEGTRAGQTIQAMRLLKKWADATPAVGAYYIEKTVEKMNKDYEKMYKGKKEIPKLVIDQTLMEEYLNAQTEESREAAQGKIYQNLADQMPNTVADKVRAWRYLSMLMNPRTIIRNVVGNAVFIPAVKTKNLIKTGLETVANVDERTTGLRKDREYVDFAIQDFEEVADIITGESRTDARGKIHELHKVWNDGTKVGHALNKTRDANAWLLDNKIFGDAAFLKIHYVDAFARYLTANKTDLNNTTAVERARQYAIKEAQKATYRDASAAATKINQLSRTSKAAEYIVEGILPFKKTPINILRRGIEYSPFGLIKALTYGIKQLNDGKITQNEFFDGIAAGTTGTGLMLIGLALGMMGAVRGGLGDDKDKRNLKKLEGEQAYSIKIGNTTYTIDWAAPSSLPFFIGAEVAGALRSEGATNLNEILDAAQTITEPMFNLSMLSGLNDVLSAVSNSNNKLTSFVAESITSYLGQFVPTVLGQVARTVDTTRRDVYVDKNLGAPSSALYFLEKMQNKIPGWSFLNNPYYDQWGRTDTSSTLMAAFENFISPGYVSNLDYSKVNTEVERVNDLKTIDKKVIPQTMPKYFTVDGETRHLTSDEWSTWQRLTGQASYNILNNMFSDKRYLAMTDDQKAQAIAYAYEYAKYVGRREIDPGYEPDSWILNIYDAYQNGGVEAYDSILTKAQSKIIDDKAVGEKDPETGRTINGSVKLDKMRQILDGTGTAAEKGKIYESMFPDDELYQEWKSKKYSSADYIQYSLKLQEYKKSTNKKGENPSQEDVASWIKKQTKEKDKRMLLWQMAGYKLDSTKEGKVEKNGNYNKYMK